MITIKAVDENIGDHCMLNVIPATGWVIKKNYRIIQVTKKYILMFRSRLL